MTEKLGPTPQPNIETDWLSEVDPPPRDVDDRPAAPSGDYEVGYKKPPKHSRYQKGRSGNPKGRRPGCKNLWTLIDAELEDPIVVKENGRTQTITKRAALAKQLVNRALSGNAHSTAVVLKEAGRTESREDDKGRLTFIIEGLDE
jgi:hypothetical protein